MIDTFNQYQGATAATAIYPQDRALEYLSLGLVSEAGEVAGKVKKVIRDNGGVLTHEARHALAKEVGDVLWYAARLADELDYRLADIAHDNIVKLTSRMERGAIGGSGDDR